MNKESAISYLAVAADTKLSVWSIPVTTSNKVLASESTELSGSAMDCVVSDSSWHPCYFRLAFLTPDHPERLRILSVVPSDASTDHSFVNLLEHRARESVPTCVAFSQRSGRQIAIGFDDGSLTVYPFHKLGIIQDQLPSKFRLPRGNMVRCLTWAADDRLVIAGSNNGKVFACPADGTQSATPELPLPPNARTDGACLILRTNPTDSNTVAAGYASGLLVVWTLSPPLLQIESTLCKYFQCSTTMCYTFTESMSLAFSPCDSSVIVSCGAPDLHLRLWSHGVHEPLCQSQTCSPPDQSCGYLSCDINPTGMLLAAGLMDGRVILYDLHRFPSAIHSFNVIDRLPISILSFAIAMEPQAEVHFKSGSELPTPSNLDTVIERSGVSVRSALDDLTNSNFSIFNGISIHGLSDLSDSLSLKSTQDSSQEYKENSGDLTHVSEPLMGKGISSPKKSHPDQFIHHPSSNHHNLAPNSELSEVRALVTALHSDLIGHFQRLNEKVDDALSQFSDRLAELQRNYNTLRLELERRFYFY